jgi:hypothetical protein
MTERRRRTAAKDSIAPLPLAPDDLSERSQAVWAGLAADVQTLLGGHELDFAALADGLRLRDRLAVIRQTLQADGLTVTGSLGQVRPNPLLNEERALRRELAATWRNLRLSGRSSVVEVGPDGRLKVLGWSTRREEGRPDE